MHITVAQIFLSFIDGTQGILADVAATVTPTPVHTGASETSLPPVVMVRGLTLGAVAFVMGLLLGKPLINWLRDHRIGKHIRVEGPARHQVKTGTPTMGGLLFLIPLVVVIGVFMDIPRWKSLLLPLGIVISCGILGGFDDLLSTVVRNQGGLKGRFKMAWLLVIATITACIIYFLLNHHGFFIPFVQNPNDPLKPFDIGLWYIPLAVFAIVGTANTVNLADGLDTLAGGTSAIAFAA